MDFSEIVEAEGHLVDSQILANIMDRVIECGAIYEVQDFSLGRTNEEFSKLRLRVIAPSREVLAKTLEELVELGCYQAHIRDAVLKPAPLDCVVPADFYATPHHRTCVRIDRPWLEGGTQRMAGGLVIRQAEAG
ncbi:MAG: TIGR00300 family protein, partial [Acidobacteriota bacterium]